MSNSKHTIAAIEIGSSRINGIVAEVAGDGKSIDIIYSHTQPITDCVRHGRIQNVLEVAREFNLVLRKLENAPGVTPRTLTGVYLGLSGRSLGSVDASSAVNLPAYMEIASSTLENLSREARFGLAPDKEILKMIPRRFVLDGSEVKKVIGALGNRLKAEYSAVVCSPVLKRNLECIKLEEGRTLERRYIVTPLALADLVLSESEKQIGTLLIDLGAQTTTMAAYKYGTLQWLKTLPFGSRAITTDLMTMLNVTEDRAREIKHAAASADVNEATGSQNADIIDCTGARSSEIIANIINLADASDIKLSDLPCGIVLAGGGALLKNFDKVLAEQSKAKVRIASIDPAISVKGLDRDPYMILDTIALAKAAADDLSITCLSAMPESGVDDTHEISEENITSNETATRGAGGIKRTPTTSSSDRHWARWGQHDDPDDEDLLTDDEDDEEDVTFRNSRKKGPSARARKHGASRQNTRPEPVAPDNEDDEIEEEEDQYKIGIFNRWKESFANWLKSEPKDDLEDGDDRR